MFMLQFRSDFPQTQTKKHHWDVAMELKRPGGSGLIAHLLQSVETDQ